VVAGVAVVVVALALHPVVALVADPVMAQPRVVPHRVLPAGLLLVVVAVLPVPPGVWTP
jgi:hypothetical protein